MKILRIRGVFFAYLAAFLGLCNFKFYLSFMSLHLEQFGFTIPQMGYCFLVQTVSYVIFGLLSSRFSSYFPRKLQFCVAQIVSAISIFLMIPFGSFDLDTHIGIFMVGFFLIGGVQSISLVLSLPEAIELVKIHYRVVEGADPHLNGLLHDTLASLFYFFYNL